MGLNIGLVSAVLAGLAIFAAYHISSLENPPGKLELLHTGTGPGTAQMCGKVNFENFSESERYIAQDIVIANSGGAPVTLIGLRTPYGDTSSDKLAWMKLGTDGASPTIGALTLDSKQIAVLRSRIPGAAMNTIPDIITSDDSVVSLEPKSLDTASAIPGTNEAFEQLPDVC